MIPETVFGLPFHVLINHGAVVLVPLAALGVIAVAAVPRWRERYGVVVAAMAVIAWITTLITMLSGKAFEENLEEAGALGGPVHEQVEKHEALGTQLQWLVLGLAIVAVALIVLVRRGQTGAVITALAVVAVLLAGVSIVQVVRTGHAGSDAVWNPGNPGG